jgi:hypothetical protein
MGREDAAVHGVRVMFHCMSRLRTDQIYVFMFCIICFGGDQKIVRVEWIVHGWVRQLDAFPSTRRWSVEVYVSQGSHQGATVVFGYREVSCKRYDPNIYKCIHT